MNELARLFEQRLGDGRVRVAETAHRDAAAQVEIATSGHIVEVAAGPVAQRQFKSRIGWEDVFLEQRPNRGGVVADNGGRRRDDLFHFKFGTRLSEQARDDNDFLGGLTAASGFWQHALPGPPPQRTTSVPTPASVKISRRMECATRPSTKDTLSTPALRAATAPLTFGIMPLSMTPAFRKRPTSST